MGWNSQDAIQMSLVTYGIPFYAVANLDKRARDPALPRGQAFRVNFECRRIVSFF